MTMIKRSDHMSAMMQMHIPPPPSTEEVYYALVRVLGPQIEGFELQQVHGQRKLYNPKVRDMFSPPEGCEVFVGRLPRDLYEDELAPPFMQVGPIYEMRTMMNFSGTNRGFAFVCYFTVEAARRAVEMLNNFEIRKGQLIGVLPSVNNRRLEIKGLPNTPALRGFLIEWLHQVTEGVQKVMFHPSPMCRFREPTMLKCYVTYTSHRAAAMARRLLVPLKDAIFGPGVEIDWADPRKM